MSAEQLARTALSRLTDLKGRLEARLTTDETNLSNHLGDTTDAHDASAISVTDAGGYFTGSEVESVTQNLGSRVAALESQSWTQPTLQNSWVDFGGVYAVAAYRKVGDVVEIRGLVKGGANGSVIFTLPTGFRPPAELFIPITASDKYAMIAARADGTIIVANADVTAWVSLSGVAFSTT